ncbi:MAG TPA: wax ester/triacylglycerol synthase family O-acyltransferase [Steroidobacteraceae bacterium]|nr:wax ester/triacylglycerol synthase family O-acyltransferase [Steroidobacteraceae bacterium]
MRQLSGLDASFLYGDERNADTHGTLVLIYDPSTAPRRPVRFKDVLAHVRERLSVSRVFRQKLARVPLDIDYPYWVDDPKFDLEYHVHHVALPKPGDWRQFCILAARLHAPPLNLERPPWEMYVVEGLDHIDWLPKGSFAVLLKVHHCAIDGHSAAELTMGLHDLDAAGRKPAPVRRVQYTPEEGVGVLRMLSGVGRSWLVTPWKAVVPGVRALPQLGAAIARFLVDARLDPRRHAVTRFNHRLSPHRVFTGRSYPLAEVKRVRLAVPGATINDTVVSIAAGAIRHYLAAKSELTDAPLRVAMPINTRRSEEFGEAGNSISAMFCEAHVDIAAPLERLAAVYASTRSAKELSDGTIGAREMTDVTRYSPAALTFVAVKTINGLNWGAALGAPFANFCVSNVPGPSIPLYLCGSELGFWNIVAPLPQGIGLFFGVSSYRDRLFIAPTADRAMVPDPQFFAQCLDRSVAEHVRAAERLFARRPELLEAAGRPRSGRRDHPGPAAMQQLVCEARATSDRKGRKRRKEVTTT